MARALSDQVERFGFGEVLMSPSDVRAEGQTSVQPDVFVIPLVNGRPAADEMVVLPVLVIEVLSPSTARYDRLMWQPTGSPEALELDVVDFMRKTLGVSSG